MTEKIEYRVRPVTRYIVTRWEDVENGTALLDECGEFANEDRAYSVAHALAFKEREDLGWPPGDERIIFADKHRTPDVA